MAVADVTVATEMVLRKERRPVREAGAAGLVFLGLLVLQNVLRAALGPATSATPGQVLAFFGSHAWTVHLLVVTYALGFVPLFMFTAGIVELAGPDPGARLWARVGSTSVVVIAVLFALVNVVQVVLVAANSQLRGNAALVQALWSTHNAVFTLNLIAVGGALLGLGVAAAQTAIVPAWMRPVSIGGAILITAAALPAVAEVHGSPVLGVGAVGFLAWLVLLGVAGTRMVLHPDLAGATSNAGSPIA